MKIDKKLIKELVDCLSEFNITEIEYQDGTKKIKVSKSQRSVKDQSLTSAMVSPTKSVLTDKNEQTGTRVKSPIIGTAYALLNLGQKNLLRWAIK